MYHTKCWAGLWCLFLMSFTAMAADIPWQKLEMSGLGCPGGDVKKTQDPKDPNTIHIHFTQFELRKGQLRKACQLVLPLTMEAKQSLVLIGLTMSGKANLNDQDTGKLRVEAFSSAGSEQSIIAEKALKQESFALQLEKSKLGKCGGAQNFRINSSLLVHGKNSTAAVSDLSVTLASMPCDL